MSNDSNDPGNLKSKKLSTKLVYPSHPLVVGSKMPGLIAAIVACKIMRLRIENSLVKPSVASATDLVIRPKIAIQGRRRS